MNDEHPATAGEADSLCKRVDALLTGERDAIANAANLVAEVFLTTERINWCGVYFFKRGELVLGPFQGKPACSSIALSRGVCGAAASQRKTLVVPDVHEFPGHIACDAASRSEIVVPILHDERLIGVLDVDSPELSRFDEFDRRQFERLVAIYVARSDFDSLGWL
jgi:L-methionine (R)-S-oxide reductase